MAAPRDGFVDEPDAGRRGRRRDTLREFLRTEAASAIVLIAAVILALVWANSAWMDAYVDLWRRSLPIDLGPSSTVTLHQLVNDGLMTVFFFVIGLEIKRELVDGELSEPRQAALPVVAALGGMVLPAAIFIAINLSSGTTHGWGIPMATDIALVLGLVALFGPRIPSSGRLFLLTLAAVDDIGAIVVIGVFYSTRISLWSLVGALVVVGLVLVVRAIGVQRIWVYLMLGAGLWLFLFESGVHATIAGVVLGLITPARGPDSVALRLERRLHPISSFVVVPLFALANAGVHFDLEHFSDSSSQRVALGVFAGLVLGKVLGISGATWMATRLGIGRLPDSLRWRHVTGLALVAGIGFTVSLFIAELAYDDPAIVDAAKVAILAASVVAGALGASAFALQHRRLFGRRRRPGADFSR